MEKPTIDTDTFAEFRSREVCRAELIEIADVKPGEKITINWADEKIKGRNGQVLVVREGRMPELVDAATFEREWEPLELEEEDPDGVEVQAVGGGR